MDPLPLIAYITGTFAWFIPVLLLISLFKTRWFKGFFGESLVRLYAHWWLDKKTYLRLHNVTLTTLDGTTQIDHVLLSPYGIFVLETKNMSGWIFGTEKQAQWTQRLYKRTFKFQNPLRQNYKHLKALEAILGVNPEHLHSVIAFVGGSSFKTELPASVTKGIGFIRYIKSFQMRVFSDAEVDAHLLALQTGRHIPSLSTHRAHVQNLKSRNDPNAGRQCPKCGNALVIRTVKSGRNAGNRFWGCSSFPACKVMQNL